jgi:1-aminocyclopropane-1-carboxylate deaminase/D-cysteine desulfhydrase-like pyridoxal-dependent ACC family enzyme
VFPPLKIGNYPTPIQRGPEGTPGLWIKRDDLVAARYGGNKVRKLERLLEDVRAKKKRRIVTIGAAGSHQVLATAIYGAEAGFEVEAVLVPQVGTDHARANLRVALAHGLRVVVAPSWDAAPALIRRDAYLFPLGGSNALSCLGFVDAAKELEAQVAAGELPEPEAIVVALGSGGTAAGLAVGLATTSLRTRVVGVAVAPPLKVVEVMTRRLAKKTAALAGIAVDELRLDIDRRWLGRGYGYSTREGERAMAEASRFGLLLDPTYTAKAFAAALDVARTKRVLYWHTLSSAPLPIADAPLLPADYERLFR